MRAAAALVASIESGEGFPWMFFFFFFFFF